MWTRRLKPRLNVETFCTEIVDNEERHGTVLDVSEEGLRLTRPFRPGPTPKMIQLEVELPGLDEIIWAKGHVRFDRLKAGKRGELLRTTGIYLAAAAARDMRLLRDVVHELKAMD